MCRKQLKTTATRQQPQDNRSLVFGLWSLVFISTLIASSATERSVKSGFVCLSKDICRDTQSMRIHYQNALDPFLQEIHHIYETPQNWSSFGIESLALWFCGRQDNDAQQIYVKLTDEESHTGIITLAETNAICSQVWREWSIDLQSSCFSEVDMSAVKSIAVGIGNGKDPSPLSPAGDVYIDDIRLYPPRCAAPLRKSSDVDITAIRSIDFEDLKIMFSDWLGDDYVTESLNWYQFDETEPYESDEYYVASAVFDANNWQSFAEGVIYSLGTDRCHKPGWLSVQRTKLPFSFVEADCRLCVKATKQFLEKLKKSYKPHQPPLNKNPQSILGLYLMDKYPGTKIADAAKQWFVKAVESSCRTALGTGWKKLLEERLNKVDNNSQGIQLTSFQKKEVPFILIYLAENGSSEAIERQARKMLAQCLLDSYGLEPALKQYQILLYQFDETKDFAAIDETTKLNVAKWLEQTGAICDAQRLYEKILEEADSQQTAIIAAENLAGIKLQNSQQNYARQVLYSLHKRFPDVELTSERLQKFYTSYEDKPKKNTKASDVLLSGDAARDNGKIKQALALYQQAARIERDRKLWKWFAQLQMEPAEIDGLSFEQISCLASFWRGFNGLLDNNIEMCTEDWLEAKIIASKLGQKPLPLRIAQDVVAIIALSCFEQGDCIKPQELVLQAMKLSCKDIQDRKRLSELLLQTQKIDDLLFTISGNLRYLLNQNTDRNQINELTEQLYTLLSEPLPISADIDDTKHKLAQMFCRIRKQHVIKLLSAEYDRAKEQLSGTDKSRKFYNLEPLIFTIQLLDKDSLEQIGIALADLTPKQYRDGQMFRFAKYASQCRRPYMARKALNAVALQIINIKDNVELLKNIAEMYTNNKSYQNAIEIYDRMLRQMSDSNEAQKAHLNIIEIYAEKLKFYDKAIEHCQKFLTNFPDSTNVSQVEFMVGKLAYLSGDYAGAVGQLDSFGRKYPASPQKNEAIMLAALSCMSGGNTQDAIERFKEIIAKYPESDLAARSKFLIGYAQVSEQTYSQALETFKQLIEQFPDSEYTAQAQSFIERLDKVYK